MIRVIYKDGKEDLVTQKFLDILLHVEEVQMFQRNSDWAIIGGLTAIHQFVRVGAHAFVGGASRTSQDVPPYTRAAGSPMKLYGLNSIGLDRRGFSKEVRQSLKNAYRAIFQGSLPLSQGLEQAEAEAEDFPEVRHFLSFIRNSERGVTT